MNIPSGGWIIAAAAAAAAAFVLDLLTPLGMVVPMLYVLSILLTRRIPGRRSTVFLTVGVVSLTWAGVVPSLGDATPVVGGNRAMASFLLLVVAGLVLKEKHLAQQHDADQAGLRESEERLVLALDGAAMGTWDWDLETDSLRWNERQFALFGIKTEDFHGTGAEALARIHAEDRPRIDAAVRRVLEEHGCFTEEFRVVHADGSVHWLFGSGRAAQLQDGRFRRVLGVNFDITERKRAEEAVRRLNETLEQRVGERTAALKAAEEWFRGIFDRAAEGIAIRDLEGRYVQCNAAYTAIVGYTEHEL
ncbi:MAG: hypothetical protein CV089_19680, partial [Nitrospira sp. WS110]|nr:hypothetical protein [Nitrospira sp. WS110]